MAESIKNTREFSKVYQNGKSYANKYLIMYIYENQLSYNRIGISVSKKVGNSVIRHRLKRLIRESNRLDESNIISGLDIVVVARVGAKDRSYQEIDSAMKHLTRMHKIYKELG